MDPLYLKLKQKAIEIKKKIPPPSFYTKFNKELQISDSFLYHKSILKKCISYLRIEQEEMGHGFTHSKIVAKEAGAVVIIEAKNYGISMEKLEELIITVQIAGLLHDIKRGCNNHAIKGSIEVSKLLKCFDIKERLKRYIIIAVRNHEAFKNPIPAEDKYGQLISDALYDADKFRWGPDNFTNTIWHMLEYENISPDEFLKKYYKGIKYIEKVKNTFRTGTGKIYGIEIINLGLQIGKILYKELKNALSD